MVMFCIRGRLLVSLFITFSLQLVDGNGSSCDGSFKCCSGYKWDRNTEKCLPCEVGYYGENCRERCPSPSFGKGCQLTCNCSEDQCNPEKGCPKGDCGPGYFGDFCDVKCRYPSFGTDCQDKCLCEQEKCDPANGCQGPDADVIRSLSSRDISSVLSTTPGVSDCPKETSIQSDAASMWKTLNEKGIGMVISITTLGLLFLILTVMYIWVSHRLHVETINPRKATEDLKENSAV